MKQRQKKKQLAKQVMQNQKESPIKKEGVSKKAESQAPLEPIDQALVSQLKKSLEEKEAFIAQISSQLAMERLRHQQKIEEVEGSLKQAKKDYHQKLDHLLEVEIAERKEREEALTKTHEAVIKKLKAEKETSEVAFKEKQQEMLKAFEVKQSQQWADIEAYVSRMNQAILDHASASKTALLASIEEGSEVVLVAQEKMANLLDQKEKQLRFIHDRLKKDSLQLEKTHQSALDTFDTYTQEKLEEMALASKKITLEINQWMTLMDEELKATELEERKLHLKALKAKKRQEKLERLHLVKWAAFNQAHPLPSFFLHILLLACLLVISSRTIGLFYGYTLNPKDYLLSALYQESPLTAYQVDTMLYFDTADASVSDLKDYHFHLTHKTNEALNESHDAFTLTYKEQLFTWERFMKNDLKIMKTPYDSQYIIAENYHALGFNYYPDETKEMIHQIAKAVSPHLTAKAFVTSDKYAEYTYNDNVWIDYFTYYFQQKPSSYYHTIQLDQKSAEMLLQTLLAETTQNRNVQSFFEEEAQLQQKLALEDTVSLSLVTMLRDFQTTCTASAAQVAISTTGNQTLESIDITFNLLLQTENGDVPFTMHLLRTYKPLDSEQSLELTRFTLNSIAFQGLTPRVEQPLFSEAEESPVKEQTYTMQDFEAVNENELIVYDSTPQEPVSPSSAEVEIVEPTIETDIVLNP